MPFLIENFKCTLEYYRKVKVSNNMHGRNEVTSTLTFNDEDWEAIFGTEDEVDDAKEPSPNSEPDAEKRKQDVESKSVAKVISTKNNSEIPTIYSRW